MTRFARSKGSKASNERVPEQATPWQVMKQQLEEKKQEDVEAKKRKEFEEIRKANYKSFLEERENKVENEWVAFENTPNTSGNTSKIKNKKRRNSDSDEPQLKNLISKIEDVLEKSGNSTEGNKNKSKKKLKKKEVPENNDNGSAVEEVDMKAVPGVIEKQNNSVANKKNKKKHKMKEVEDVSSNDNLHQKVIAKLIPTFLENKNDSVVGNKNKKELEKTELQQNSDSDDALEEVSAKVAPKSMKIKVKLPKKVPMKIPSVIETNVIMDGDNENSKVGSKQINRKMKKRKMENDTDNNNQNEPKKSLENEEETFSKSKKNKKHNENHPVINKNNKKMTNNPPKSLEGLSEDQIRRFEKKKAKRQRQLDKKKQFKAEAKEKALKEEQNQQINNNKRQLPKPRDNEVHHKRKPNSQIQKMNINGVEIEIDYYDGFPIKKEDADRLRKLRKEMISKGIPKSEVQIALKLERRKAEKALTREKKKVCFNCRKSGHVLSECPDLNENSMLEMSGTGICFKCGSTEHTHFECKVTRKDDFKFATCFICREQGHISRQCPDNQRGLYPKGGACRVCGDVTHLKKDCPKFQAEQETQTIKLDTLEFDNVESLSEEKDKIKIPKSKANKIVKF